MVVAKEQSWKILPEGKDYPSFGSKEEKIKFVLHYAILAPSTHNSQPWNFKIKDGGCAIYYDKSLKLPYADPKSRDLYISMGAMLTNLRVAAEYFGIWGNINYLFEDNLIAKVSFDFSRNTISGKGDLLSAICSRVNVRGIFSNKKLDFDSIMGIFNSVENGEVFAHVVTDKNKISNIGKLTVYSLSAAHADKSFRYELSQWMHHNFTKKLIGLPGYSLRMPFLLSFIIPIILPYFNLGSVLGKLNNKSINSSQAVGVITSNEDRLSSWLRVGEVFEIINLELVRMGLNTSIYVASIEMGNQRSKLQKLLNTSQLPQFLFCIGYMKDSFRHTPRVPLEIKII